MVPLFSPYTSPYIAYACTDFYYDIVENTHGACFLFYREDVDMARKQKEQKSQSDNRDGVVSEENLPIVSMDECEEFDPSGKKPADQEVVDEEEFEELEDL